MPLKVAALSFLPIAIAALAASITTAQEGMLQGLARQAKAEGRQSVRVTNFYHQDVVGLTAEDVLKHYSIGLVTIASPVLMSKQPSDILAWQRARLERMLRVGPVQKDRDFNQREFCATLPKPAGLGPLGGRHVGIAASGGTVTIDEVDVTIDTGLQLNLTDGRRYLVIGFNCGEVLYLPDVEQFVFDVDAKGNLTSTGSSDDDEFIRKLLQLRTITAIERYVRALR